MLKVGVVFITGLPGVMMLIDLFSPCSTNRGLLLGMLSYLYYRVRDSCEKRATSGTFSDVLSELSGSSPSVMLELEGPLL